MTTRELIYALLECNLDAPVDYELIKRCEANTPLKVENYKGKTTYIEKDSYLEYKREEKIPWQPMTIHDKDGNIVYNQNEEGRWVDEEGNEMSIFINPKYD